MNNSNLIAGLSYLKYALSNGIPVIVGMGTDNNGKYFSFYDNASGNSNLGASSNNKLYYNT